MVPRLPRCSSYCASSSVLGDGSLSSRKQLQPLAKHYYAVAYRFVFRMLLSTALQARRSIDHAFRRPVSKVPGPQGSSPQPTPPLDGTITPQPPALGLGPPATALGVSALSSSSAAAVPGRQGLSALNGLQGLNLALPRQISAMGSLPLGGLTPPGGFSPPATSAVDFASAAATGRAGMPGSFAARRRQLDLTLLANAEAIYGPLLLEERNLLLAGGKIVGLLDDAAAEGLKAVVQGLAVLDCSGCLITPGFLDCHVHITGGGGEAGPASRWVDL